MSIDLTISFRSRISPYLEVFTLNPYAAIPSSTLYKAGHVGAIIIGILGQLPYIPIALESGGNSYALRGLLTYGSLTSFGILMYHCTNEVVTALFAPIPIEERAIQRQTTNLQRIIFLITSIIGGVLAQTPSAVITHYYGNRNILLPITIYICHPSFSIYSLMLAFEDSTHIRCLSYRDQEVIVLKEEMTTKLHNLCQYLETASIENKHLLINQLTTASDSQLETLFLHRPTISPPSSFCSSFAYYLGGAVGAIGTAMDWYCLWTLTQLGAENICEAPEFVYPITAICTGIFAYLDGKFITTTAASYCKSLVDRVTGDYQPSLSEQLRPKLTLILQLLNLATAAVAYGPTKLVVHDYLPKSTHPVGEVFVPIAMCVLVSKISMIVIENFVRSRIVAKGTPEEKLLIETQNKLSRLENIIHHAHPDEIRSFHNENSNLFNNAYTLQ